MPAQCERYVARRVDGKIYGVAERPAKAEVTACARIEAVVGALNVDGKPCGGHDKIRRGGCKASRFVVAYNGDQHQTVLSLTACVGSLELNPVGAVWNCRGVERGNRARASCVCIQNWVGIAIIRRIVGQRATLERNSRSERDWD